MQYFGGKYRTSKTIVTYLNTLRQPNQIYFEPFVGAANVICRMDGIRIGSDAHPDLILLLQGVRDGTISLPDTLSLNEYNNAKSMPSSALRGFIGFGCSFAGKWFGGMARSGKRNYCLNTKNSLIRKRDGLIGVELFCKDYREYNPEGQLIYCDPPYQETTKYSTGRFDHNEFWDVMRQWSNNNTVIISEYDAPSDFKCVLEIPVKTDMRMRSHNKENRIERLFTCLDDPRL